MNVLIIVIIIAVALYGYLFFYSRRVQPANLNSGSVLFDNLVPTAGIDDGLQMFIEENEEKHNPELVEDAETALLFESEKLLGEIDAIVRSNHDVYAKLGLLLPNYAMFKSTEYYELINKYITLSLQEDCGIQLNETEIEALWA